MRDLRSPLDGFISPLGVARGAWTPASLFGAGGEGVWLAPSPTTCFTDLAGTTPAGEGDSVALMLDMSGNDNHATQLTAPARPTLQKTTGGLWYLEFDGLDNDISIPFDAFNATGDQTFAITAQHDTGIGGFIYLAGGRGDTGYLFVTLGSTSRMRFIPIMSGFAEPVSDNPIGTAPRVWVGDHDRSTGVARLFEDGTEYSDTGAANTDVTTPTDNTLYLGSGSVGGTEWKGKIFAVVAVDRLLSLSERGKLQTFLSEMSGATL